MAVHVDEGLNLNIDLYLCSAWAITVNSEIFARILFSRIALKDIYVMFKLHDKGISVNDRVILSFREVSRK